MTNYGIDVDFKWQKYWEENETFKFNKESEKEKLYVLEMLPYPSGSQLHVGHWFNFAPVDSYARMKKMQGYNVFQPMGFDAFGLPAENFAIKTGIHPKDSTFENIANMQDQLKKMGAMFSWDNEIITCTPEYYKWTQFIFLKLFEKGLAYRKNAPVNWCPSCNTVLANEQVVDGACERCSSIVTKKNLTQWFFKITEYADELLDSIDSLDWPQKTKAMQKHWIGKSVGSEVIFKGQDVNEEICVFTTRIDTLFGVTYVVIAPENPLADAFITEEYKDSCEKYKEEAKKQTDIERQSLTREKTGVFTGSYAINPVNGKAVPVWLGDYVLGSYGTGCVMAVPAHDDRDFAFAKKFNLDIKFVISKDGEINEIDESSPFTEDGILINSGEFTGNKSSDARESIVNFLSEKSLASKKVNFRLRDWLVSRQRYWGTPIPIVYCDSCGMVPVPEKDLPVVLPYDVEFSPDGDSPLSKSSEFVNTTCPKCGGHATRDIDTLDTFVCSSWYYLRYVDNKNDKLPFDKDKIDKMVPVDKYVGGPEHAVLHLLYARFFAKALRDMGYLSFDEPFKSLIHQGLILGSDGFKMSKNRGNTISPNGFVEKYGSDVFRLYLMFGFSYADGGAWNDEGIKSVARFIDRCNRIIDSSLDLKNENTDKFSENEKELNRWRHNTIKEVTKDTELLQFNTVVARLMEYTNALYKYTSEKEINTKFLKDCIKDLILLLAPFAPHFCEEKWNMFKFNGDIKKHISVTDESFPKFDESALILDEIEIALQVCGKIKLKINISKDLSEEKIKEIAKVKILPYIDGKEIVKMIVIKDRLVNVVVK